MKRRPKGTRERRQRDEQRLAELEREIREIEQRLAADEDDADEDDRPERAYNEETDL